MSNSANAAPLGILVCNLGTPEQPTPKALRRYLKQFLWDRRVVDLPRPLWWLLLHGIVLRTRPRKSAAAYSKIWTQAGSPLLVMSKRQTAALGRMLRTELNQPFHITLGMRYGEPSIAKGLQYLQQQQCNRIVVLPLYPQYCAATTASSFDAVFQELQQWRVLPSLHTITSYFDHPEYIQALTASVRDCWKQYGRGERLLFSFHGIPKRYVELGDPYRGQCERTAELVATSLELNESEWLVAFQSRFGREEWIKPYSDEVIPQLAQQGVQRLDVMAPGFAADCLETLEEIGMQYHDLFLAYGGQKLRYIPALNDRQEHITMLSKLILTQLAQEKPLTQRQEVVYSR